MPPRSKSKRKQSTKATKTSDKSESVSHSVDDAPTHRELFMHVPFDVFCKYTNIKDLVVNDLKSKRPGKPILTIAIKNEMRKRYDGLQDPSKYEKFNMQNVRWLHSDENDTPASIWSQPADFRADVHDDANDHQKKFLYLPLNLFLEKTNVRSGVEEHFADKLSSLKTKEKRESQLVSYSKQFHKILYKIDRWEDTNCRPLKYLKFVDEDLNGVAEVELKPVDHQKSKQKEKHDQAKKTDVTKPKTDSSNVTAQHVANHTSTQPAENVMPSPHLQRRITDWLCGTAPVKRPNDSDKGSPVAKKRMRRSSQPSCSKNAIDTVDVENEPTGAKVVAYADKQKSLNKIPQNRDLPSVSKPMDIDNVENEPTNADKEKSAEHVSINSGDGSNQSNPNHKSSESEELRNRQELYGGYIHEKPMSPSKFQREIQALSFEDFVAKTNIKEIIQESCQRQEVPDDLMETQLKLYYGYRLKLDKWRRTDLKNIEFKECSCKRKLKRNKPTALEGHAEKSQRVFPSEFEKQVIAFSEKEFVDYTNIVDLVCADIVKKKSKPPTQNQINFGVKHHYDHRKDPRTWKFTMMQNLKFKTDKEIQTVNCSIENEETQCSPEDFNANATEELSRSQERQQDISSIQKLTVDGQVEQGSTAPQQSKEGNPSDSQQGQLQSNLIDSTPPSDIEKNQNVLPISEPADESLAQSSSQNETNHSNFSTPRPETTVIPSQPHVHTNEDVIHNESSSIITSSSQAMVTPPAASQALFSIDEVRMSELIVIGPNLEEVLNEQNPLETMPFEYVAGGEENVKPIVLELPITMSISADLAAMMSDQPNDAEIQTDQVMNASTSTATVTDENVKLEPDTLEYHLNDDSDVQYVEREEEVITINDSEDAYSGWNDRRDVDMPDIVSETLVTVETQPICEENNAVMSMNELISVLSGEPQATEDIQLPNELRALRNIGNYPSTTSARTTPIDVHVANRSNAAQRKSKNKNTKKGAKSRDDTLSNVPVPKYDYRSLNFAVGNTNKTAQTVCNVPKWNDELPQKTAVFAQPSQSDSHDYSIEDSSFTDESDTPGSNPNDNNIGIVIDSCVERENLLNEDLTLFLNVDTQQINSSKSPTHHVNQPTQSTSNQTQSNCAPTVAASSIPISSIGHQMGGDRTEFLHHIEILNTTSALKNIILPSGKRSQQLNIEVTLQHQCNGNNRIVVNGDALKLLMNLIDSEWQAIENVLKALGDFRYDAKNPDQVCDTIIHRIMRFFLRTAPKISNVHISYGEHDLETARVIQKPSSYDANLTSAISPFVLSMMKAKSIEMNNC